MDILDFKALQAITGYTSRSAIERVLNAEGIKFFRGRKGPWTTQALVNAAGGLMPPVQGAPTPETYGVDLA